MDNIIENNRIIAEFMGFIADKSFEVKLVDGINTSCYYYKDDVMYLPEVMAYHSDWSWLMEVVEKIESLPTMKDNGNFFFEIHQDSVTVFNSTRMDIIIEVIGQGSRINNTYQAVIEFIQWYNKQNKNNEKHTFTTKVGIIIVS